MDTRKIRSKFRLDKAMEAHREKTFRTKYFQMTLRKKGRQLLMLGIFIIISLLTLFYVIYYNYDIRGRASPGVEPPGVIADITAYPRKYILPSERHKDSDSILGKFFCAILHPLLGSSLCNN